MSWKLAVIYSLVIFGSVSCLTDLKRQCVAQFNEDLDNDIFLGTWYRVMFFSLMGVTVSTTECPTFVYEKPTSTELARYKDDYLKPGIPYSFGENPVREDGGRFRPIGLVIGNKQAKFYIIDPNSHYFRHPYELRIYQRISDKFILFQTCNSRGHSRWLMSRDRNPSRTEVEAIIQSRPDLANMSRQWYCVVR